MEQMMTVSEVSSLLRVHYNTIYMMCKTKEMPCVRIGRNIRIKKSVVEGILDGSIEITVAAEEDGDDGNGERH